MQHNSTLPAAVATSLRSELPTVAARTVSAVVAEVPSYVDAFGTEMGRMGRNIENAVRLALEGFLELATSPDGGEAISVRAVNGAYALGQGEVRSGRTVDALLAAYRIGARVAWREMSAVAVAAGLSGQPLAEFAELVFAYIDELSAASVTGHADELATSGRVRQRQLERLATRLLAGAPAAELTAAAERADWVPPASLTAVILSEDRARGVLAMLDPRTLHPTEDLPELPPSADLTVLLVPDADGKARAALTRPLQGRGAVIGPARPWTAAHTSYRRALRAVQAGLVTDREAPVDTELRLAELVLRADPEALDDLRAQVLAPLGDLRASTRDKLVETLRSWLLNQGRRDDVAAELHVHAQTVRYRMGQLRDLYGDRLDDPDTVLALTIALATPA